MLQKLKNTISKNKPPRTNSAKYCSRSCLGKANGIRGKLQYRNRITVECSNCKAKIEKKPSVVYNHNFCSINCMAEYYTNTKMFAGENSGTWQGGDIDYYGKIGEIKEEMQGKEIILLVKTVVKLKKIMDTNCLFIILFHLENFKVTGKQLIN